MKKFKLLKLHWSLILSIFLLVLFLAPSANVFASWDSFTKGINIGGTTMTSSLGNTTASVLNSVTSVSNGIVSGFASLKSSTEAGWNSFTGMIRDGIRTFLRIRDYEPGTSITSPAGSGPSAPSPTATTTIIQQISQAGLTGKTGPQGLRGFTGLTGPMGPQGIQGPAGTSSLAMPEFLTQAGFVTKTFFDGQVDRIFSSITNSTRGLADSLDKEVSTILLAVSGNATVGGDLTVTGNITGNVLGTINPSFTLGSIPFQGASGLAEDNANFFYTAGGVLKLTTSLTNPLLIGGTAVGDYLTYKSTTGVGTVAGIAHQFVGGTNGGTVIATMLNNGNVGIGTTSPSVALELGADKSLRITGGTSFPSSPSEGQMFFRADTKQLYVYANSKWQADRSTVAKIVAASNSSNKEKADYVCDGTDDQVEIQAALDSLTNGGVVQLLEGRYNISAPIKSPAVSGIVISGTTAGYDVNRDKGVELFLANGADSPIIEIDHASMKGFFEMEGMILYGNKSKQTATEPLIKITGYQSDIYLDKIWVDNGKGAGIYIKPATGNLVWDVRITNGFIESCDGDALYIDGTTADVREVYILNELITVNDNGINLVNLTNMLNHGGVNITDSNILKNKKNGVIIDGSTVPIHILSTIIADNGSSAANTYDNILIKGTSSNVIIGNNTISNIKTSYSRYGVNISDNSDYIMIDNNFIRDNISAGINIAANAGSHNTINGNITGATGEGLFNIQTSPTATSSALIVTQSGTGYGAIITGGNVGIGTTAPRGILETADGSVLLGGKAGGDNLPNVLSIFANQNTATGDSSADIPIWINHTGGGTVFGIYLAPTIADTDATNYTSVTGFFTQVYPGLRVNDATASTVTSWSGVASSVKGIEADVVNFSNSTGTITSGYGGYFGVGNSATGIIRNAYGIYANKANATGTDAGQTHNAYGIYIANNITATGGATNNAYALYSVSTKSSYFAGNLGIGTTTPLLKLDVTGSGRFTGAATSVLTGSINPTASTAVVGVGTLFTTELVVGDRITVNAETRTVTAITNTLNLTVDTAFTDTEPADASPDKLAAIFITRLSNNAIGMVQNNLGNVGIGNTAPAVALHVGSTSVVDSTNLLELQDINSVCTFNADTGAPSCGSDITLKKNINNQTDNLTKVLALQPVTYNWLTDQEGTVVQHGFIAQAVAEVMPELVHDGIWTDGTTRKFLQTSGMIPYMVGAIKDLDLKLEDLTNTEIGMVDEAGAETFTGRFFDRIKSWLGDAGNGVEDFFVNRIHTKELCVAKSDGTEFCANGDQLEAMVGNNSNNQGGGGSGGSSGSGSDTPADTTAPIITLTGEATITLNVGDAYTEAGATATDEVDGTVAVIISGAVDTATVGTYTITYNAMDVAGNSATEITRTVNVEEPSTSGE